MTDLIDEAKRWERGQSETSELTTYQMIRNLRVALEDAEQKIGLLETTAENSDVRWKRATKAGKHQQDRAEAAEAKLGQISEIFSKGGASSRMLDDVEKIMETDKASGEAGVPQGRCETTLTERFAYPDCRCGTYEGNLGPCKTWEPGENPERCVYCDHALACHEAILGKSEPDPDGGERFKPFPLVTNDSGTVVWIVTDQGVHMTSKEAAQRIAAFLQETSRLRAALEGYIDAFPAFRLKPIGSPHSLARMKQDKHIALEDQARAALEASKEPGDG